MDIRLNLGNLDTPNDILRLTSIISEMADTLDVLITSTAPNGVTNSRQGKIALYDNSGTWELWVNTDGAKAWERMDFGAYSPPDGFPSGGIIMWSGSISNIPTGWVLCNGSNSTPDLRDKFIVGAGSTYAVADNGGEATHTLTTAEIPAHTHPTQYGASGDGTSYPEFPYTSDVNGGSAANTGSAGSGTAHNNLPPYYALAYIMKS